ncbi:MAG: hypothetical protein AAGC68_15925, partial [Verrucomicrobiota bacterium]
DELQKVISRINQTTRTLFSETFSQIAAQFRTTEPMKPWPMMRMCLGMDGSAMVGTWKVPLRMETEITLSSEGIRISSP